MKSSILIGTTCFLVAVQSLVFFSYAQPAIQWQNTIGGNVVDYLYSIEQTVDGGYILGGTSSSDISGDKTENSNGSFDYWVTKLDASGLIQWQNAIGGDIEDDLQSIHQTIDGGYILGGHSKSNISGDKTESNLGSGTWDYWVVKIDSVGNVLWENTIGGSGDDRLKSIQQTFDKGYILGGYSDSNISGDKTESSRGLTDYWVVKIDSSGNIQWQKTIGGNGWDDLNSIQQSTDRGYILGGSSGSDLTGDKTENRIGDWDYWVVKLDSSGSIQWQNTIGGGDVDYLHSIQQTTNGGYILGGESRSNISVDKTENNLGGADYWIVKIDSTGILQWENTIGGSGMEEFLSIEPTTDGGFISGGYSYSNISGDKTENSLGSSDFWVIKLDSSGFIKWQNTIGGNSYDELQCIKQTSDGGFILGGHSESDISGDKTENSLGSYDYWIVKLGNPPCSPLSLVYSITDAIPGLNDGAVKVNVSGGEPPYLYSLDSAIFQHSSTFTGLDTGTYQVYVVDSNGCTTQGAFTIDQAVSTEIINSPIGIQIFPNPFSNKLIVNINSPKINVNLKIVDVLGRVILSGEYQSKTFYFNAADIPEGMYFLEINCNDKTYVYKVVKED